MEVDKYAELYKQKRKYRLKKRHVFLLIALVAILTNPSQERHQHAVKDKFDDYMQHHSESPLTAMQENPAIDQMILRSVTSTNYLFLSTTNVVWNNGSHTVGLGIFGMVFISGSVDSFLGQKYN